MTRRKQTPEQWLAAAGRRYTRKPRKLHLRSVLYKNEHYPHCGVKRHGDITIANTTSDPVLSAAQLVWTPVDRQCARCHRELLAYPGHGQAPDYVTCDTHSATPEMLTTIEVVLHAFGDWCRYIDGLGDHTERGCYFDWAEPFGDRAVCWCGKASWLEVSPSNLEAMSDAVLDFLRREWEARAIEKRIASIRSAVDDATTWTKERF